MTISQLITRLIELQTEHGPNVEVLIVDDGCPESIEKIESAPLYWDKSENGEIQILISA